MTSLTTSLTTEPKIQTHSLVEFNVCINHKTDLWDAFFAKCRPAIRCWSSSDFIEGVASLVEQGKKINILSLGEYGQDTDEIVSYLVLNPTPINIIYVDIQNLTRAGNVAGKLRVAGYSVEIKRIGIEWLREFEKCPTC